MSDTVLPGLGKLLVARHYKATGYFVAAAFIGGALPCMVLYVILTSPPQPLGYQATVFGCAVGGGLLAALPLLIKGRRKRGSSIEAYEHGMRFISRSGMPSTFLFTDVAQIRRKTIRGALAEATFMLADGRKYTAGVHDREDLRMLEGVLQRFE